MNLIDLVTRKDKSLIQNGFDLKIIHSEWLGRKWRGLEILESKTPQLVIKNYMLHHLMQSCPQDIGWFASISNSSGSAKLVVTLELGDNKEEHIFDLMQHPIPVLLSWPNVFNCNVHPQSLSLHFILPKGVIGKLLVHQKLDRKQIIGFAQGKGVEIGPGPNPQIISSKSVNVEYVEESPIEEWIKNYDLEGKYGALEADFSKYIIGTAWNLPQLDHSLDFIFSSHVFEHLANPIGHLVRWKQKLKHNGAILAVVPDMLATKDYQALPSSLKELQEEFQEGFSSPSEKHYCRWANLKKQSHKITDLMAAKVSIHAHFYTPETISILLDDCVKHHGFNDYLIIHRKNHKDFYFILR